MCNEYWYFFLFFPSFHSSSASASLTCYCCRFVQGVKSWKNSVLSLRKQFMNNSLITNRKSEGWPFGLGDSWHGTMVYNNQEFRIQYWATRSSIPTFAHSVSLTLLTHLLAPHCLLRSRALLCLLNHSLAYSLNHSWAREVLSLKWTRRFHTVSTHCGLLARMKMEFHFQVGSGTALIMITDTC